ncbi:MAG: chemotaxis protein CheW [Sphaerospermopsis kisseleviana]|uniref:CheW protein n=2 Tax=Sphaerospermopsis TaxID=752201 RepID=A0A480A797_9CYAN|nr:MULTISPECIES: chemotaxis protein CheW [Sphaerospermopsis]BAZ80755.1 CheW protein [Sphaerospermopsis kisseleviana NIES-73]MBD2134802.1 chemotaxis protein CheW [Sphaerospermopsis sp. FACHB-1094]MBD2148189.1 chemotaxis protein CheW [Sphaerospermopsis sp. FACHB-1194]MDB9440518.1 chemotaxis protein CheW [Sphaerospermopsis kisseleviana CS-549]GCL39188.1 CheW protein [Sphaerospermopsis reniformis]
MVSKPDFLSGSSPDQFSPELQLESPDSVNVAQAIDPKGELHLRFYIPSQQEFALPATGIREVIELSPDRITPIPNTSPLLLGTLNLRGRLIWVADLGQFLGDATPLNTDRSEIPVIAIEDQDTIVGLGVEQICGMGWLDVQYLMPANNVPDTMAPFLRGEWIDTENNKYLRLIDQTAILRSARWAG